MPSEFQYLNRGFQDSLVMIPGWATDYRIFNQPEIQFNYLFASIIDPADFVNGLKKTLDKHRLNRVSLFGWSMGGFLALDFAKVYPETVKRITLCSIRRKFQETDLNEIKKKICENKKAFLFSFYLDMFKNNSSLRWFRTNLMKEYFKDMQESGLLAGLDYLAGAEIKPKDLQNFKNLKIIHAKDDLIMPFAEAQALVKESGAEFTEFDNGGHALFLGQNIWTKL